MKIAYTDGSCHGNPGPGGFGVVLCEGNLEGMHPRYFEVKDAAAVFTEHTTNNEQELQAIHYAIVAYGPDITIFSDSAYCVNIFNEWIEGWKKNGWRRAKGKPIENLLLIKEIYSHKGEFTLKKCTGHADNIWNNLADDLANGRITPEEVKNTVYD